MARLNIEDTVFIDRRLRRLEEKMGSPEAALGALIYLWFTAQKYWKKGRSRIPKTVWIEQGLRNELIEAGWAEWDQNSNGFYASGSEGQFDWLLNKQAAGKIGGIAKSKNNSGLQPSKTEECLALSSLFSAPLCSTPLSSEEAVPPTSKTEWDLFKEFCWDQGLQNALVGKFTQIKNHYQTWENFLDHFEELAKAAKKKNLVGENKKAFIIGGINSAIGHMTANQMKRVVSRD